MLVVGVVYARDVSMSNPTISNVNVGEGTCTINYTLSRTSPTISASQPIWVFVKYRLSGDSDYTGWQDTDDHTASNDNSDGRFTGNDDNSKNQCDGDYPCTVNKYLNGDVGMVNSGGPKQITWTWGAGGTGLSSANSVRVRVYAVEMVLVPNGGAMMFGTDTSAQNCISSGSYAPSSAYYLMKYPCTAEMYAAFLNCCANRHDPSTISHYDFYSGWMTNEDAYDRLDMTGTIGNNAMFTANGGQEDYMMTYVTWRNAYDWCKWAGLRMPTEEEFEYEASYKGTRDFPWGDDEPNNTNNIRCNMQGVDPSNASDVRTYDEGVQSPNKSGLSAHNAAEMAGNMFEWQFTRWYNSAPHNSDYSMDSDTYAGYGSSSHRVHRGAVWCYIATWMRAASRRNGGEPSPPARNNDNGFRAARAQ